MNACLRTPQSVRRIEVIEVVDARGFGDEHSPVRQVVQYWSMEGRLLAEHDPYAPQLIDTMNSTTVSPTQEPA
jgi:hypothetical protein